MRLPMALSLYVSLAFSCMPVCAAAAWMDIHDAGQTAVQRHDYETALRLFQQSWQLASANDQRAYAANDLGVTLNLKGSNPALPVIPNARTGAQLLRERVSGG